MVNVLRYRDKAEYVDGRDTNLSGREAYGLCTEGVRELLKTFGGSLSFKAPVERLTIGEVEELWDDVAIAMYPSRDSGRTRAELGQNSGSASGRLEASDRRSTEQTVAL
jgi:hypothetical protein